jgi:GntR family transcriptional regulator/MocR family aminotransferase
LQTILTNRIKEAFQAVTKTEKAGSFLLYTVIRQLIEQGQIPFEVKLPPTRFLSEGLGIARSTAVKAYDLLVENRYITASQGSGYQVIYERKEVIKPTETPVGFPDISDVGKSFLNNIHLLSNSSIDAVAFTPGLPPLDVFPIGQWQKLTNLYWRNIKASELNYSISSGVQSLKQSIADYLLLTRGIKCDLEQVIIVSGSLQSLYLIGNVLINKGDKVVLENPTFPNVISIFSSLQADIIPIATDEEGMQVEALNTPGALDAHIVHTTPSNQYPLGGKMSLARRMALIQWAQTHNKLIIENDYEHEINNSKNPIPSIFSLDTSQRTIFLGTFNRILHPSIRLGYMLVPPYLLPTIKALQMHSHRFVPQSIQVVMQAFINQNHLFKHIRSAIAEAALRKKLFINFFEKYIDPEVVLKNNTTPSFHLIAITKENEPDVQLVKQLESAGISTHALSKCYIGEPTQQGLILGYSSVSKTFMQQSIQKMGQIIK